MPGSFCVLLYFQDSAGAALGVCPWKVFLEICCMLGTVRRADQAHLCKEMELIKAVEAAHDAVDCAKR